MRTLLFTCMLAVVGCTQQTKQEHSTAVFVIRDITDSPLTVVPLSDPIIRLYRLGEYQHGTAAFRYTEITDRLHTPVEQASYSPETSTVIATDEPLQKQKQAISFYNEIRTILTVADTVTKKRSYNFSECFSTIAVQLTALIAQPEHTKILLVFSNLQEQSNLYSCYDERMLHKLETYPEDVAAIFSQQLLLPKTLAGITVVFIFAPQSREEDKRF